MVEKEVDAKGKKEDKPKKTLVVEQLPSQVIREGMDDKGNEFLLVTSNEALTEILDGVRRLIKALT